MAAKRKGKGEGLLEGKGGRAIGRDGRWVEL